MQARERRAPKYLAIAADLGQRIRDGEYAAGSALPSQRDLSTAYAVTLATLRQALQVLENEGLLTQQPGRGTFVAEPRAAYQLDTLRSLADDLVAQGQTVSTEIIDQGLATTPDWVAERIGAGVALRLERVRLLAGRRAVHQVSWVPAPAGPQIAETDFSAVSLYGAIAGAGLAVHRATETLRPGLLGDPAAELLRQPAGAPVFVSDRTTYVLDGSPVVFDRATILGTVMEIRTERVATGLSLRWSRLNHPSP
jgi:GntR family transcriptional regulator